MEYDEDIYDKDMYDEDIYDEDYPTEETEYKVTYKDYERLGGHMLGLGTIFSEKDIKTNNIRTLFNILRKKHEILTGEQLFQYSLEILIYKLKNDDIMTLGSETTDDLINSIYKLNNPKYINPLGYILGYMATNGGKTMEKAQFNKTLKLIPNLKDYYFTNPDLIRYSKLWLNLRSL